VPVTVEFTPDKVGEIAFACGLNMLRGTVVVQWACREGFWDPGRL